MMPCAVDISPLYICGFSKFFFYFGVLIPKLSGLTNLVWSFMRRPLTMPKTRCLDMHVGAGHRWRVRP